MNALAFFSPRVWQPITASGAASAFHLPDCEAGCHHLARTKRPILSCPPQPKVRCGFGGLSAGEAAAESLATTNFSYTSNPQQTWVVPTGVSTIQVRVVGGKGGDGDIGFTLASGSRFGLGARTGGAVERAIVDDVEIITR
jgi:hypothetical protein